MIPRPMYVRTLEKRWHHLPAFLCQAHYWGFHRSQQEHYTVSLLEGFACSLCERQH